MTEEQYIERLEELDAKDEHDWWKLACSLRRDIEAERELSLEIRIKLLKILHGFGKLTTGGK